MKKLLNKLAPQKDSEVHSKHDFGKDVDVLEDTTALAIDNPSGFCATEFARLFEELASAAAEGCDNIDTATCFSDMMKNGGPIAAQVTACVQFLNPSHNIRLSRLDLIPWCIRCPRMTREYST